MKDTIIHMIFKKRILVSLTISIACFGVLERAISDSITVVDEGILQPADGANDAASSPAEGVSGVGETGGSRAGSQLRPVTHRQATVSGIGAGGEGLFNLEIEPLPADVVPTAGKSVEKSSDTALESLLMDSRRTVLSFDEDPGIAEDGSLPVVLQNLTVEKLPGNKSTEEGGSERKPLVVPDVSADSSESVRPRSILDPSSSPGDAKSGSSGFGVLAVVVFVVVLGLGFMMRAAS